MTSTPFRKKLIEVSIPLVAINDASAREKQIKVGKPASLHNYWAPRPLAACRAVLFAQLVDDPGSCPEEFGTKEAQDAERDRLHELIKKLVPWEAAHNEGILSEARYEIARSVARDRNEKLPPLSQMQPQKVIAYLQSKGPLIYDPFSGGGLIPLEAQRLGLRVQGSDLNPVAVLIGKALVELPPKFAGRKPISPAVNELRTWRGVEGLVDDVRHYADWIQTEAEKKVGAFYPKIKLDNGQQATVIAWLWARTVRSPDPRAKGAEVPLASSFALSSKEGKPVIVTPVVDRSKMEWRFEIDTDPSETALSSAKEGTKVAQATFTCVLTGAPIGATYIDAEAQAGRMSERLMAVVVDSTKGRIYLPPTQDHVAAAKHAASIITKSGDEMGIPTQECRGTFASNAQGRRYKFKTFADYFTSRQLIALTTLSDLVIEVRAKVLADARAHWSGTDADDTRRLADGGLGPTAYADAVATYLAFCVDRSAQTNSTLCRWVGGIEKIQPCFDMQSVSMTWDFGEANVFGPSTGSWRNTVKHLTNALAAWGSSVQGAEILAADATSQSAPLNAVVSTDPPYYSNIGYADLSDYFYVWLHRTLCDVYPDYFRRRTTPKAEELVATQYRAHKRAPAISESDWAQLSAKDRAEAFFLEGMKQALQALSPACSTSPATIYYAYKQSEAAKAGVLSPGWATFLQAVVDAGLSIDGTWPIRSEHSSRSVSQNTNALASSVLLVCRQRDGTAPTMTRTDFLRALRREMPQALAEIRHAGVGPTDIQQAAIGPGIGIFTRYAKVLNTDGTPMAVRDALKLINQVREEIMSTGDADYDSETRFALDWFAAHAFAKGRSGDAITMTNAVNVALNEVKSAGFFEARGSDARLLKRDELPNAYDPAKDKTPTVWEACQHLIKRLTAEGGGIDAAAALYNRLGARAEAAHALARRLYDICEQKQWAAEGRVYNQLHQEWGAIEKRAAAMAEAGAERDLFSR